MSILQRFKPKGSGGDNNKRNSVAATSDSRNSEPVSEGFLCPECRVVFDNPDALQSHFIQSHTTPSNSEKPTRFVCPQCMSEFKNDKDLKSHFAALHELSENRDGDVLALRLELNDLRASLKEEKWYSEELKKEMDKLQTKIQENFMTSDLSSGDEVAYYLQQIQALEAGKALVTSKMLELEKQLSEANRNSESIQRERNKFFEKSTSLSQEHVASLSQLDELKEHKIALTENLTKLQEKICDLEAQLDARPSEDDVSVLRKELVHAQTLMDQVSKETENESMQYQIKCSQLEGKCSEYEDVVRGLTQKMEQEDFHKLKQQSDSVEHEMIKVLEEKEKLTKEVEKCNILRDETQVKLEQSRESIKNLTLDNETLLNKINSVEQDFKQVVEGKDKRFNELNSNYVNLKSSADLVTSNSEKINQDYSLELQEKYKLIQDMTNRNAELSHSLATANSTIDELSKRRQVLEADVFSLKEELTQKEHKLNEAKNELETIRNENVSLNVQLKEITVENGKKENVIDQLKAECRQLETKIDEISHELEKKVAKFVESENCIVRLTEEKDFLLKEKKEMFDKLQVGEEGVTTALQQLTSEKNAIEEKFVHLKTQQAEERRNFDLKSDQFKQAVRETKEKFKAEQDKSAKLQNLLENNEEKVVACDKLVIELKKELESKKKSIMDLEYDQETLKNELETNIVHFNDAQTKFRKEIDALHAELQKRNSTIIDLQNLIDDLSKKFETELKSSVELTKKLDNMESDLNTKISEAEKWLSNFKEAEAKSASDSQKLVTLEGLAKEWEEKYSTSENKLKETEAKLSSKEQEFSEALQQLTNVSDEKTKVASDLKQFQSHSATINEEVQKEKTNLELAFNKSNEECKNLRDKVQSLTISKEELNKLYGELNIQFKERDQQCSKQNEEALMTNKKSQQIVEELKSECLQLKQRLNENIQNSQKESAELTTFVSGLEVTVNDLRKQVTDAEVRENEIKTILEIKSSECDQLVEDCSRQKNCVVSLEAEIKSLKSMVEQFTSKNGELENKIKRLSDEENKLKSDKVELDQRYQSLQNKLQSEISAKQSKLSEEEKLTLNLQQKIGTLEKSTADLAEQLAEVSENRDKLDKERSALHKDLEQRNISYADLDATKIQLENLLKDLRLESESEMANEKLKNRRLETEKSDIFSKHSLLENQQSELEAELSELKNNLASQIEVYELTKSAFDSENQSLKSQLSKLQAEKEKISEAQSAKINNLELSYQNVSDNFSKIQQNYGALKSELETTKKDLKITSSAKEDLEAQLNAWSEEKRMLLERCLMFEKDVDEEKDNGRELKRRLDDAISAMHELGRENQSLQIDMSKHVNRKWADDNEAVNCNSCGKLFSVTVRKHHCRHCGMIFCNECSSKACAVASSKKPVRVCDNCFTELS